MKDFLNSLQIFLKVASKHWGVYLITGLIAILTLPVWIWFVAPDHPLVNTYWHSVEFKVRPNAREAAILERILLNLLVKNNADLVAIGYYAVDKEGIVYIAIGEQTQRGLTPPILNSKYYLINSQLWERYRAHKDRECFLTYFEQSGTWSLSCGVFYKTDLLGYLTVEFKAKPDKIKQESVTESVKQASLQLEKSMPEFFNKIHKMVSG